MIVKIKRTSKESPWSDSQRIRMSAGEMDIIPPFDTGRLEGIL
jgi:hypothetical protein